MHKSKINRKKRCPTCNNLIYKDSKSCRPCIIYKQQEKYKNYTLKMYHEHLSIIGKHSSWKNAHIRILNRNWNKHLTKLSCYNCGYKKHVELAHIKAITTFPEETTLRTINNPNNIIQLCPNCHWEFDNKLLIITI